MPFSLADTAVDFSIGEGRSGVGRRPGPGACLPFGKGRVVVLGEATAALRPLAGVGRPMGMNVPGIDNRQMALNIMHWLSGLLELARPHYQEGRMNDSFGA